MTRSRHRLPRRVGLLLVACTLALSACIDTSAEDDEQGVAFSLYTHCGISELTYHGECYSRVGGPLDDDNGNPPEGWDNPEQSGQLRIEGDVAIFTDTKGHDERFELRPDADGPMQICSYPCGTGSRTCAQR